MGTGNVKVNGSIRPHKICNLIMEIPPAATGMMMRCRLSYSLLRNVVRPDHDTSIHCFTLPVPIISMYPNYFISSSSATYTTVLKKLNLKPTSP